MSHRRPPVRAVPWLIHLAHMLHHLHARRSAPIAVRMGKASTNRGHLRARERHADHDAPPARATRKHRAGFRAAHDAAGRRAVLEEVNELRQVYGV
jgi:hypothetical protein